MFSNQIEGFLTQADDLMDMQSLCADEISAYLMAEECEHSLMDSESQLIDDTLLENFNALSVLYDQMRGIEWEHR